MLNTIGNKQQLHFLQQHQNKKISKLTSEQLKSLLNTKLLSTVEKLEIIEIHLGLRFLTEAQSRIEYSNNTRKDGLKYPTIKTLNAIEQYLHTELHNPTSISKRKSKRLGVYAHVINIFANQTIRDYFVKFEKNISPLEIGLLYGYHEKAILAFCGYIESCPPPKAEYAYQYFNSKVYPKDFDSEVDEYHKLKWNIIKSYCPEIIELAESEFKSMSTID